MREKKAKEIRNNSPDNLTGARAAGTFQSYTFFVLRRHENIFRRIIVLTLSSTYFFMIHFCVICRSASLLLFRTL